MFVSREVALPGLVRGAPAAPFVTVGGGAITLLPREAEGPVPVGRLVGTVGGGGTTSVVPNIFPSRLLTSDVLPVVDGGGGTTVRWALGALPLARARRSREALVDGGGAMTGGAGNVSRGFPVVWCSGAETGGGIGAESASCTGEREASWLTATGAGRITPTLRAGALRVRSRETFGAGATTPVFSVGETRVCSRETLGAGGMTVELRTGAARAFSRVTLGAGGTIPPSEGADRERS